MTTPAGADVLTQRLRLRPWRSSDLASMHRLNSDPAVMRYFPGTMTREDSQRFLTSILTEWEEKGYGLWFVETRAAHAGGFVGFVGLRTVGEALPIAPAVEVGWRLVPSAWGHGYASEAARVCLDWGFERLGLQEIVSYTSVVNHPSQRVMRRLGMVEDPASTFEHPSVPVDSPLRRHVVYRLHISRVRTPQLGP